MPAIVPTPTLIVSYAAGASEPCEWTCGLNGDADDEISTPASLQFWCD